MKKPMNQFLDALRGLEKLNTPISAEIENLDENPDQQNNNNTIMLRWCARSMISTVLSLR